MGRPPALKATSDCGSKHNVDERGKRVESRRCK
jgi:hypothetical protein